MSGVLGSSYANKRRSAPHLIFRYRARAAIVASAIRDYLPGTKAPKILDLGCAEGSSLLYLRELVGECTITGVELSAELLDAAPAFPVGIELVQGDICKLPEVLEEGSFDVVSALAVLEHLPEPGLALREAARMLRPGGIFVATVPHPLWDRLSTVLGLLADGQHASHLDRKSLDCCIRESDLAPIEYGRFMWAPVGVIPYAGLQVPIEASDRVDRKVRWIPLLNRLFVNQYSVARKKSLTGGDEVGRGRAAGRDY